MVDPMPTSGANTEAPARIKRKYTRRKALPAKAQGQGAAIASTPNTTARPPLGLPDPLWAAQEAARCAQEGNLKLAQSVEALRQTLETIVTAEYNHAERRPVSAEELRELATTGLDTYSRICGQNWRRAKLTGPTRAGDRSEAREMSHGGE